jgi:hypothetical protein
VKGFGDNTFFTTHQYNSSEDAIKALALDQDWQYPNKATYVVEVVVPGGTTGSYRGKVAGIPGKEDRYPGGGFQVYIPGAKNNPNIQWGTPRKVGQ